MARIVLALALVAGISGSAAVARAQPADRQVDLYRRAFEAFQGNDYAGAEALLRSALRLGDQNILHLSLARALYHQGRCTEAVEELALAEAAPPVPSLPRAEVHSRVAQYRADLERVCPGTVRLRCEPADLRVRVGDRLEESCSPDPLSLLPGDYPVVGRRGDRAVRTHVVVRAMQESVVALRLPDELPHTPAARPVAAPSRGSGWRTVGLVAGLSGAVVAVGGLVADVVIVPARIDDFRAAARSGDPAAADRKATAETWQTLSLVGYAAGAVLVGTGTVLFLLGGGGDDRDVRVGLSPGGLTASGSF